MPMVLKLIPRRRRTWVEIVPDRGDSIRLPREVLPASIDQGCTVDSDSWQQLSAQAEYYGLKDRALRILSRREHFARELERKLMKQSRDREIIARIITECRKLGYIDDNRAAELTTAQLIARGGIGKSRLKQELIMRGCPVELTQLMVKANADKLDEAAVIQQLLTKRRSNFAGRAKRLWVKLAAKHADDRRAKYELRQKLNTTVRSFLSSRGLGGADAAQPVRELVEELLSELNA